MFVFQIICKLRIPSVHLPFKKYIFDLWGNLAEPRFKVRISWIAIFLLVQTFMHELFQFSIFTHVIVLNGQSKIILLALRLFPFCFVVNVIACVITSWVVSILLNCNKQIRLQTVLLAKFLIPAVCTRSLRIASKYDKEIKVRTYLNRTRK